jgi:hypothetical protein
VDVTRIWLRGVGRADYKLPYPNLILTCSYRRGSEDIIWRKCLSTTNLSGGGKIVALVPCFPVYRQLISSEEILNTCMSGNQHPGRSKTADNKSKEEVWVT